MEISLFLCLFVFIFNDFLLALFTQGLVLTDTFRLKVSMNERKEHTFCFCSTSVKVNLRCFTEHKSFNSLTKTQESS